MQVTKGHSNRDPFYKAVEEVSQDLDLRIKDIINSQQRDLAVSTTDVSPARVMSFLYFIILLCIKHLLFYLLFEKNGLLLLLKSEECVSHVMLLKV